MILAASSHEVAPVVALLGMVLGSVVIVSLLLVRAKQSLLVGYFACGVILANIGATMWLGDSSAEGDRNFSGIGSGLVNVYPGD